jgi:hypothetical protein
VVRSLLICGLLAGALAGVAATGFAEVAGEPAIGRAIAFEQASDRAAGVAEERPVVSRTLQRSLGLVTAATVYGTAIGGLFALAFVVVYGRVGRASPAQTAVRLAAAAFVVVFLVPFVKYPANPPSVGDPDTIGRRTTLYLAMIAISLLAALAAVRLRRTLYARQGAERATLAAAAVYLVVVVGAGLALPAIDEVPAGFPAGTLFRFREASVGTQAVLWATIGLVFAATARRVMAGLPMLPRAAWTQRDGAR